MPTDAQIRTALDTLGTHQLAAHECFGGAAAVLRDGEVICESSLVYQHHFLHAAP